MQDISIIGIIVAVVVLVILLFMAIGYVKAPPDMAYIISGVKKKSKVVIGKASIRIPFFERLDKLESQTDTYRCKDEQCSTDSRLYQYQRRCYGKRKDQ